MSQRDRLISAMIGGRRDLEGAYRYSPEFQAQVTVIADMLPIILNGLVEEAYRGHQWRTQAYEKLAYNPSPTVRIHDEMIEALKKDPEPTPVVEP